MARRTLFLAAILSTCGLLYGEAGQQSATTEDKHAEHQSPSLSSNQVVITNQDVVSLVKAGLSAEIVAAKVKNSTCKCDTSPAALAELKKSGVPDNVILAMVQAPAPVANKPPGLTSIRDARTVYLVNQTTDVKVFDQLRGKLKEWGRWKIVDREDDADLLLVLSMTSAYAGSISTASASGTATYASGYGMSVPLMYGYFYLIAVDRVSQRQLTAASTIRHTISSQSVSALMNQINKQTEKPE
jgi:hypothetical protein